MITSYMFVNNKSSKTGTLATSVNPDEMLKNHLLR